MIRATVFADFNHADRCPNVSQSFTGCAFSVRSERRRGALRASGKAVWMWPPVVAVDAGAMETERIALSQRERDRLRMLHELRQKQITQSEAARRLKISDRHVRRLLVELGKRGDRAAIHGLRERPSNRRLAARWELKILRRCGNAMRTSDPHWPPSTWPRRGCR